MLKHHFIHNILEFAVATDAKNKQIWLQPEKIFGIIDILFGEIEKIRENWKWIISAIKKRRVFYVINFRLQNLFL